MTFRPLAVVLTMASTAVACASSAPGPPPARTPANSQASATPAAPRAVNADAQVQKTFLDAVQQYLQLRAREQSAMPKLGDEASPEKIAAHQKELLARLQAARTGAKAGALFTPEVQALVRQLLGKAIGSGNSAPRQAIREEDPGALKLTVNSAYPTSVPLPTVPPQALQALPRLPDDSELEFRVVGRRLILLDARVNMIVDVMDNALP